MIVASPPLSFLVAFLHVTAAMNGCNYLFNWLIIIINNNNGWYGFALYMSLKYIVYGISTEFSSSKTTG